MAGFAHLRHGMVGDPVDRTVGDTLEYVPQVGFGIEAVQLDGADQAVDRGSTIAVARRLSMARRQLRACPAPTRYSEVRWCPQKAKSPSIGEDGTDRPVDDLYSALPMRPLGHSGDA